MDADARARAGRITSGVLLFVLGVALSLYYGRRGFMPLDQSIVFDGGWRVLSGQVPFRDFHAPNGFVAYAIQAVFFAGLGVSWLSYCLHAALLNGLFAVVVWRLLAGLGLGPTSSFIYGALSALVLVPPIGVPYMESHAFFFSLLGIWMALVGRRAETKGPRRWPWLLIPPVLLVGALSKQIPTVYVPPIVLVIALFDGRGGSVRRLLLLTAGSASSLLLLVLVGVLLGVEWEQVETYLHRLPSQEGARRYAEVSGLRPLLHRIGSDAAGVGLGSILVVHAIFVAGIGTLLALRLTGRSPELRARALGALAPALLAEGLLAVCLLFTALTLNQAELGVAYVFLAAGLAHLALARTRKVVANRIGWSRAAAVLGGLVLLVALRDGLHFTTEVNATRSVNDIVWQAGKSARPADLHPGLAFMQWQTSPFVPYAARDLTRAAEFLAAQQEGFLLIGDASVLYGLTGKPSVAPSLWFHPALTVPGRGDEAHRRYERILLDRMERLDVRYVVVEGRHTWNHISLASFPRLARRVKERGGEIERFGGIAVIDLRGQEDG